MPNLSLLKDNSDNSITAVLLQGWLVIHLESYEFSYPPPPAMGKKRVLTFPKGISSKVNAIVRLEFEITYFEAAVKHFSHYVTRTPSIWLVCHKTQPSKQPTN